jgi:hypothetical protein
MTPLKDLFPAPPPWSVHRPRVDPLAELRYLRDPKQPEVAAVLDRLIERVTQHPNEGPQILREYYHRPILSLIRYWGVENTANIVIAGKAPSVSQWHARNGPRNADILARRQAGETYAAIAKDYGICKERVAQIVRREEERNRTG